MKVFISWSGERSKAMATHLRRWLPDVIQTVQPWMSEIDIEAGARWGRVVEGQLSETKFGILCITRENLTAPWLLFEAGALAKTIADTFVCPYLLDIAPADIPAGPLSQFQAKRSDRDGTAELLQSVNTAMRPSALPDDTLRRAFDRWWPDLDAALRGIPAPAQGAGEPRPANEMIKEILDAVRELSRSVRVGSDLSYAQRGSDNLDEVLAQLPPRDAKYLRLKLGLDGGRQHTAEEIGSMLGLSHDEVRALQKNALTRLGKAMASMPRSE